MDSFLKDIRYSVRMLRKTPGASLVAVIALAMGIGLTTLMFSIVYGALMRGLPFDDPQELVQVLRTNPERGVRGNWFPIHDFEELRSQQRSFDVLGAHYQSTLNLSGGGEAPERLKGAYVTPELFPTIGERPAIGRWLEPSDAVAGAPDVMMIGWQVWQDRYAGDPGVLGRTVRVNGLETTIVGVMPRGFGFPFEQNAWLPMRLTAADVERGRGQSVAVTGRLRDGVTVDMAAADLSRITRILETEYPETNEGWGVRVADYAREGIGQEAGVLLGTMFGAVVFVLLIACANVTNVLMGRAMLRSREVAVRTALGAARWRIASQFLIESLVLAVIGGTVGALIAAVGINLFNAAIVDTGPPFWLSIRLDGAALACAGAAALVSALVAGAAPALQAARANTNEILKDEARGSSSFRQGRASRGLVMFEMALSVALLLGAGLMIKSVIRLNSLDLGFSAERIFSARMLLTTDAYPDAEAQRRFVDDLEARLAAVPAVASVAVATSAPGLGAGGSRFAIEGVTYEKQDDWPVESNVNVSAGYFTAVEAQILRGRDFTPADRDGGLPVAIINEAFERTHFNGDALGRRIRLAGPDSSWRTIVGIAPDLVAGSVEDQTPETLFLPLSQIPSRGLVVLARTDGDPASLYRTARETVNAVDPDLPIYQAGALSQLIATDNWYYGVFGALFGSFGFAALFLASVGLYGVMAFSVGQRTREMGVRMAMGATPMDVLRLVMKQGMVQTGIGLAAGTALGLAVSNLLAGFLFRVETKDPFVFATIITVLVVTAALACWIPAKKATSVDPLVAIRYE